MKEDLMMNIEPLVDFKGGNGDGCFVSDMIISHGYKVGLMYREEPDEGVPDSGWRFLLGTEEDDYLNNPDNIHLVDINTLCNYDVCVIPYLDAPYGSSYIRVDDKEFALDDGEREIYIAKRDANK